MIDIVGPEDATKAVIDIYDVFGLAPQTLQGADRLSEHIGALVLVPDFLLGIYAQAAWFPVDTPEKQKAMSDFRTGPAGIEANVERLLKFRKALSEKYPAVDDHTAVGGLCWGGYEPTLHFISFKVADSGHSKVAVIAAGPGNEGPGRKFTASWTAHPG